MIVSASNALPHHWIPLSLPQDISKEYGCKAYECIKAAKMGSVVEDSSIGRESPVKKNDEATWRKGLRKKFRRLLIKGKARFNFLLAAKWRIEATKRMQTLVQEEKRTKYDLIMDQIERIGFISRKTVIPKRHRSKGVAPAPTKEVKADEYLAQRGLQPGIAQAEEDVKKKKAWWKSGKPVQINENESSTISASDEIWTQGTTQSSSDDDASEFMSIASASAKASKKQLSFSDDVFAVLGRRFSIEENQAEADRSKLTPTAPSESKLFASKKLPSRPPSFEFRVYLGEKPRLLIETTLRLSARSVQYDQVLRGWRFLTPGLAAIRIEFVLIQAARDQILVLNDFSTDEDAAVDVLLDGCRVVRNHKPLGHHSVPTNFEAPLPAQVWSNGKPISNADNKSSTTSHVLEIALRPDATPWAYRLQTVSILDREANKPKILPATTHVDPCIATILHSKAPPSTQLSSTDISTQQARRNHLLHVYHEGQRLQNAHLRAVAHGKQSLASKKQQQQQRSSL